MWKIRMRVLAALLGAAMPFVTSDARAESSERAGSAEHVAGTTIAIELAAGEWIVVGTCGMRGARHSGDTVLRLRDPEGVEVSYSDDACGGLGSRLSYRATRDGTHQLVLGCYAEERCGGQVVWGIGGEEVPVPFDVWDLGFEARALVGPEGQGLLADAWLRVRLDGLRGLFFSLAGAPLGIAGGADGGVLGGGVHLVAGWDLGFVEIGVGGGVSTLSRRADGLTQREAGVFALQMRFGALTELHFAGRLLFAFLPEDAIDATLDARVVLPIDALEVVAHGVYGMSGVALGEIGFVYWPEGGSRRGVGVSVLAGGGAVFYQPVCRFGLVCTETLYVGPHVGFGLHVRP